MEDQFSGWLKSSNFQRRAQFYVDFIESENSNGFHAPQEATRNLGESINFSLKGQVALRDGSNSAEQ
jgi:nitrite reductase (cytochrome c-552)